MEKQEIEKFVGIPYKFLGTDYTGVDLIGRCMLNLCKHGDIILFEINGESHTGIYVGYGKALTILEVFKKSMIMHLYKENVFYQCGFRMREC